MLAEQDRKRRADGPTARSAKKAKAMLSGAGGGYSPSPTVDVDHELVDSGVGGMLVEEDVQLETFRKEALWRQMQEYKRDLRRMQEKLSLSEELKSDAEHRLAAVDVCWNQLVEDIRILFNTNTATVASTSSFPSIQNIPNPLQEALSAKSAASRDLIVHLLSLTAPTSPDLDELRERCRQLTTESASSRAALSIADSKIKQLQDQLETSEESLRRAEKRLDRERSRSVRLAEGRAEPSSSKTGENAVTEDVKKQNGVATASGSRDTSPRRDNGGIDVTITNGTSVVDSSGLHELAESRLMEINGLRTLLHDRIRELDDSKLKLLELPLDIVKESAAYKKVETELGHVQAELETVTATLELMTKETNDLRERQDEFRASILSETTAQIEEMERKMTSKDADITRVRGLREEIRSELHETKTREIEKMKSVDEIRTLANSRQDRIIALSSEVRRLRMAAAAENAEKGLVEMYIGEEGAINNDLSTRLKSTEQLALGLRDQLRNLTKSAGGTSMERLLESEAQAKTEVVQLQERLADMENIYGSNASTDMKELASKLKSRAHDVEVLETKLKAQEGTTTMLFAEVDRLSAAWATLDEQNREKVFKLAEHDEKIIKAVHEKAKADNKYFAAMRTNEQLKSEGAVFEKMSQKQTVTIDKLQDELRASTARLTATEKEISLHVDSMNIYKSRLNSLTLTQQVLQDRVMSSEKQCLDLSNLVREKSFKIEQETNSRLRVEESLSRIERDNLKLKLQVEASSKGTFESGQVADLKSYNEDLNKMLKCNSCKQRFKSHVITRCMHLFCGACLDARIETRQRKCPSCQIGFGAQDVCQVYF